MQATRKRILVLGSVLLALAACGSDDEQGQQGVMLIDHYKVPCEGVGPQLCMRATALDGTEYSNFYGAIEGFDYQWGHRYALRVEVTEVADPPADGSSLRHELVEVITDDVVNERFELELYASFVSGDPATGTFSLLGERDLTCAEPAICEAIAAALADGESITVELGHSDTPAQPLIVHATH